MTWSEFIEGTGCQATEYNYEVFKHLEGIYMISDVSKAEIYEYGKALVDDSKAVEDRREETLEEKKLREEIEECRKTIQIANDKIRFYQNQITVMQMIMGNKKLQLETLLG